MFLPFLPGPRPPAKKKKIKHKKYIYTLFNHHNAYTLVWGFPKYSVPIAVYIHLNGTVIVAIPSELTT